MSHESQLHKIPAFSFVLIDLTTEKTRRAELAPEPVLDRLTEALVEQVRNHWGRAYGKPAVLFRVLIGGLEDRTPTEIAIHFRDEIPEAPGALAYHTVTDGVADIEIGCGLFTSLEGGNESLTQGVSHEILETLSDAGANGWKELQDGSGRMRAEEICDSVQNTSYPAKNGIALANFLLPSAFIPGAPGPWDYMGVMKSQDDIANGYEIQALAPSEIQEVSGIQKTSGDVHGLARTDSRIVFAQGTLTATQKKRKRHPYSRTYRRGVKL